MRDWHETWRAIRRFDSRGLLFERTEGHLAYTRTGYVFDKRFIWVSMVVMLIVVVQAYFEAGSLGFGWRETSAHCPADSIMPCQNPCYRGGDRCGALQYRETLQPGERYGPDPSAFNAIVLRTWIVIASLLAISIVANHIAYNIGKVPFHLEDK